MDIRILILATALALPLSSFARESTAPQAASAAPAEDVTASRPERCDAPLGSRIRPRAGADCDQWKVHRRYTAEQLEGTGASSIADAMRRLWILYR